MGHISYSSIFEIDPIRASEEIRSGDMVRMGQNLFPHFAVMAVVGDKAWVRNVQTGLDSVAPTDRCHRIDSEPLPVD